MLNYLGLPAAASSHAADLDNMTVLVHWLMLVLFVGWGLFFLFVLVRFRRGANPTASYAGAKGKQRNRRSRAELCARDSRALPMVDDQVRWSPTGASHVCQIIDSRGHSLRFAARGSAFTCAGCISVHAADGGPCW